MVLGVALIKNTRLWSLSDLPQLGLHMKTSQINDPHLIIGKVRGEHVRTVCDTRLIGGRTDQLSLRF